MIWFFKKKKKDMECKIEPLQVKKEMWNIKKNWNITPPQKKKTLGNIKKNKTKKNIGKYIWENLKYIKQKHCEI